MYIASAKVFVHCAFIHFRRAITVLCMLTQNLMNRSFFLLALILAAFNLTAQPDSLYRGVYYTYQDFRSGNIHVVDSFYLDSAERTTANWRGTWSVKPRYVKNNKLIRRIWGFSDGMRSYIAFQSEFFPLEFFYDEISFEAYDIPADDGAFAAGLLFGFVGAVVYEATATGVARSKRVRYVLASDGNVYHASAFENDFAENEWVDGEESMLVLYRGTHKETDEAMHFTVNGMPIEGFAPGSYLELLLDENTKRVEFCPTGSDDCTTVFVEGEVQYVECFFPRKKDESHYQFLPVLKEEGEFRSVWSYDVQQRRNKKEGRARARER